VKRKPKAKAAKPERPMVLRYFQVRIELLDSGASVATAHIDVPDYFLGLCVFEALYFHGVETASPLRRLTRTDAYKNRITNRLA
jgi:hypothetical protein